MARFDPTGVLALLQGAGGRVTGCAEDLPPSPGAYLLAIHLSAPLDLYLPRLGSRRLPEGWYAYAGSAWGPGGIRARVARHLRRCKPLHWHVDRITAAANDLQAIPVVGGEECDLLNALLGEAGCRVIIPGFGSSDCRRCPSHLLALW